MIKISNRGPYFSQKGRGAPMIKNEEKKSNEINFNELKPDELMKYEIAKELGLFEKVMDSGWKSLSAKETGRIGGLITKKKRERNKVAETK